MPITVDLSDVPVIDNHCHAVETDQQYDLAGWRRLFSESPYESMHLEHVTHTALYQRMLRATAAQLGVPATETDVLAARNACSTATRVHDLFTEAAISGVVIDTGYPAPDRALPAEDFVAASGCSYRSLLRVEVMFERLIAEHSTYDELKAAVEAEVADIGGRGYAGLKTVVGYRSGLAIRRWPDTDVRAAFDDAREEVSRRGTVRLGHQPLLDSLLHQVFASAARQELPVQFHVGYGDPDVDLRRANPLELRAVLEDPAYRGLPIVLLHGCWPYFREGAYLASVYDNVYLDISYAIPYLSIGEMRSMTRAAFGVAPLSKVMYSSDGARVPELHWLGAREGRRLIAEVLEELVVDGDLDAERARAAGICVLRSTAARLYRF